MATPIRRNILQSDLSKERGLPTAREGVLNAASAEGDAIRRLSSNVGAQAAQQIIEQDREAERLDKEKQRQLKQADDATKILEQRSRYSVDLDQAIKGNPDYISMNFDQREEFQKTWTEDNFSLYAEDSGLDEVGRKQLRTSITEVQSQFIVNGRKAYNQEVTDKRNAAADDVYQNLSFDAQQNPGAVTAINLDLIGKLSNLGLTPPEIDANSTNLYDSALRSAANIGGRKGVDELMKIADIKETVGSNLGTYYAIADARAGANSAANNRQAKEIREENYKRGLAGKSFIYSDSLSDTQNSENLTQWNIANSITTTVRGAITQVNESDSIPVAAALEMEIERLNTDLGTGNLSSYEGYTEAELIQIKNGLITTRDELLRVRNTKGGYLNFIQANDITHQLTEQDIIKEAEMSGSDLSDLLTFRIRSQRQANISENNISVVGESEVASVKEVIAAGRYENNVEGAYAQVLQQYGLEGGKKVLSDAAIGDAQALSEFTSLDLFRGESYMARLNSDAINSSVENLKLDIATYTKKTKANKEIIGIVDRMLGPAYSRDDTNTKSAYIHVSKMVAIRQRENPDESILESAQYISNQIRNSVSILNEGTEAEVYIAKGSVPQDTINDYFSEVIHPQLRDRSPFIKDLAAISENDGYNLPEGFNFGQNRFIVQPAVNGDLSVYFYNNQTRIWEPFYLIDEGMHETSYRKKAFVEFNPTSMSLSLDQGIDRAEGFNHGE